MDESVCKYIRSGTLISQNGMERSTCGCDTQEWVSSVLPMRVFFMSVGLSKSCKILTEHALTWASIRTLYPFYAQCSPPH